MTGLRLTRRGWLAVCVAGAGLGLWSSLWDALPWAVTLH